MDNYNDKNINEFNDNNNNFNNINIPKMNTDESINNEMKKKSKRVRLFKMKKKAALKIAGIVVCATILGNAIGFGVGFYSSQIEDYAQSLFTNLDENNVDGNVEAVKAENDSKNPIVNVSEAVVSVVAVSSDGQMDLFGDSQENQSVGSGIIFHQTNKNVYIVTNYHVISGAASVNVSLDDEKYVPATLVGKHQLSDIAVLSIDRKSLKDIGITNVKTAYFGDSDKLNVGDLVIAIGNAFGNGDTATKGIVSVINKDIPINNTGESLSVIQTDAAINVGNDGGALINSYGEVIGINTAKYANYTVKGVGYSIASNIIKPVIEEIMNKQESPYLGVSVRAITSDSDSKSSSSLPDTGVLVEEVVDGSAADIAGIEPSDIITSFNSSPVFTPVQLTEAVRKCHVGDTVEIKLIRGGKRTLTLSATLMQDTLNKF